MIKVPNSEKPTGPKAGLPKGGVKDSSGLPNQRGGGKTTQSKPIKATGANNSPSITKTVSSDPNEKRSAPSVENKKIVDGPRFGKGKK
jgi:hypothetical protein